MRILAFGDSITQGFYDTQGGWVERLRSHFDELLISNNDQSQPTVFNLGVSGDTSVDLLARLENEIVARTWRSEELVIVIAIGTNDTIYRGDKNDFEPEEYAKHLGELVDIAKKHTKRIAFVGMTPVVDELLQPMPWSQSGKCYSTERTKLFNAALQQFCQANQIIYIDLWSSFESAPNLNALFFDGAHPNDKGHELIAGLVQPNVEELVK